MKNIIKRILIIIGFLFILISIIGGLSIIVFSFKFVTGVWVINLLEYIFAMIGLSIACMIIAIIGIIFIYIGIDDEVKNAS